MLLGFAIGPILSLTCCLSSAIKFSLPSSVPIKDTKAAIASPVISSLRPITAASATALCETNALSTSAVDILCPDTVSYTHLTLPTIA